MQTNWKKIGAVVGSALMIGATLAGAAFAQDNTTSDTATPTVAPTNDLGDYKELMVSGDNLNGMFVVGETAATADVVSAMNMVAYASQLTTAGTGGASGEITLTPEAGAVNGLKRHVEFDQAASESFELASGTASDNIGPSDHASGDGAVTFLFSDADKGTLYLDNTETTWYEQVTLNLSNINAARDTLDSQWVDQYDEVYMTLSGTSAIQYVFKLENKNLNNLSTKKIWFMGKEYTVISVTTNKIQLGSSDAEVVLSTSSPSATVGGVDTTLGGIYSASSNTYKAKLTVTNGGTTETKYVTSGNTETIAGIKVYVSNAVVTTTGTNEGEAQLIVGAGILDLKSNLYTLRGDGTETRWKNTYSTTGTTITMSYTQPRIASAGNYPALSVGDSIAAPNDLFRFKYEGITDQFGNPSTARTIYIQPETNTDVDSSGVVSFRTPGGNYIKFSNLAKNQIWMNSTGGFWYRLTNGSYAGLSSPTIEYKVGDTTSITAATTKSGSATDVIINVTEPATKRVTNRGDILIEWNVTGGKFAAVNNSAKEYVYYNSNATTNIIAREITTPYTRDYLTIYGTRIEGGQYLVTLTAPEGQAFAEFSLGTEGAAGAITANAGDSVKLGTVSYTVGGSVSGDVTVTLPTTIAKIDSDVLPGDKSAYTLVLVGGPAVNTLVNGLQTTGKLPKTIGGPGSDADIAATGAGVVESVEDAFGTGTFAFVVAGSDRAGTNAAANILANYDTYMSDLDGLTSYEA